MNRLIKVIKRIKWGRVIIALLMLIIFGYGLYSIVRDIKNRFNHNENEEEVEVIVADENVVESVGEIVEEVQEVEVQPVVEEKVEEQKVEVQLEVKQEVPASKKYRLTSYYPEEGSDCTGSGKCSWDFGVDEHGWYTYNGKLVIAAATKECLNSHYGACNKWNTAKSGRKYFKYYEELKIVIDGVTYDAIVLDSCGASMYLSEDRIDLFVSSSNYAIDRGYKGVNMVTVYANFS